MLIGTYEHSVDAKGRLQIPARLRSDLGEAFIATKGVGDCLFGFSLQQWSALCDKLKELPLSNHAGQGFLRMLAANAFECVPDKQGRILIPKNLRDRIGLEREAVVAGVMTRIEIWPKARWETYTTEFDEEYESLLGQLESMGI